LIGPRCRVKAGRNKLAAKLPGLPERRKAGQGRRFK
jgi:hypothetical protein